MRAQRHHERSAQAVSLLAHQMRTGHRSTLVRLPSQMRGESPKENTMQFIADSDITKAKRLAKAEAAAAGKQ